MRSRLIRLTENTTMISTVLLLQVTALCLGKTLDNQLIDTPTVSCGPTSLTISAISRERFEGQVFIKSQRGVSPDCRSLFDPEMNSTSPFFSLPLSRISSCGLEFIRDSKSLRLSTVVVFAFHPQFVTAGDRAFAVHCLFQQKDVHVETQFDSIHDINSISLTGISLEIPRVEMKIVNGRDESNDIARSVEVGSSVMLIWRLVDSSQIFGIRVVDCLASDIDGNAMTTIKEGCSADSHLMSNVRYSAAEDKAFSEVTAFKLPDQEQLFFRCSIAFCIKQSARMFTKDVAAESSFCQPSKCEETRQRREISFNDPIIIIGRGVNVSETLPLVSSSPDICVSSGVFALTASFSGVIYTAAAVTGVILLYKNTKRKRQFEF